MQSYCIFSCSTRSPARYTYLTHFLASQTGPQQVHCRVSAGRTIHVSAESREVRNTTVCYYHGTQHPRNDEPLRPLAHERVLAVGLRGGGHLPLVGPTDPPDRSKLNLSLSVVQTELGFCDCWKASRGTLTCWRCEWIQAGDPVSLLTEWS